MTRHIQHASRHLQLLQQSVYPRLSQSNPIRSAIPRTLSTTTVNPNRSPRTTHPAQYHHHQQTIPFSTSSPTMSPSDDDAYAAFLNSANQPLGNPASSSHASGFHATKTVDEGLSVPRALVDVGEVYYVSEADEVWEPVALRWEGEGWPDEEQFKSLIFPTPLPSSVVSDLSLESLTPSSFDPQNHYAAVMRAVGAAAAGGEDKLRVWRVGFGRSRAEYWVLGLEEGAKRIVGMKARAVET